MADKQRQSMQDHYEKIERARAVLLATPKSQVRDSTAADYLRKVQRLRTRGQHHGGGLFDGAIAEELKTTKKSSWRASRAALLGMAPRISLVECAFAKIWLNFSTQRVCHSVRG
jgi:hypothetical protein